MAPETIEIDLELMESMIADPELQMQNIGEALGVSESTIYNRRKNDAEHNRYFERGMIRREAACVATNGSDPDDIVLRAIGLGFETRSELKRVLGFSYDVIEKAIERNAGDIETEAHGSIEILRPKEIVANQSKYTCVDCGGPRSYGSGQRCKRCYDARSIARKKEAGIQHEPLGEDEERAIAAMRQEEGSGYQVFDPTKCGCGRPVKHGGRCSYRRREQPSLHDEILKEKRAQSNGHNHSVSTPDPLVPEAQKQSARKPEQQRDLKEKVSKDAQIIPKIIPDAQPQNAFREVLEQFRQERDDLDRVIAFLERRLGIHNGFIQ